MTPSRDVPRWVAPMFLVCAAVLLVWDVGLAITLPTQNLNRHYGLSWVGFDLLLAFALFRTGWLAAQHRTQVELPAVVTANLLLVDAWFDVTSSAPGNTFWQAVLLAAVVELPLAALCLAIALKVEGGHERLAALFRLPARFKPSTRWTPSPGPAGRSGLGGTRSSRAAQPGNHQL